jgi:hypothetical protein
MRVSPILCRDSSQLLEATLEKLELLPAEPRSVAKLPRHGDLDTISINELPAMKNATVFPIEDQAPEFTAEKLEALDQKVSALERNGILDEKEAQILHMLIGGQRLLAIVRKLHLKKGEFHALVLGLAGKVQTGSRQLN